MARIRIVGINTPSLQLYRIRKLSEVIESCHEKPAAEKTTAISISGHQSARAIAITICASCDSMLHCGMLDHGIYSQKPSEPSLGFHTRYSKSRRTFEGLHNAIDGRMC